MVNPLDYGKPYALGWWALKQQHILALEDKDVLNMKKALEDYLTLGFNSPMLQIT